MDLYWRRLTYSGTLLYRSLRFMLDSPASPPLHLCLCRARLCLQELGENEGSPHLRVLVCHWPDAHATLNRMKKKGLACSPHWNRDEHARSGSPHAHSIACAGLSVERKEDVSVVLSLSREEIHV